MEGNMMIISPSYNNGTNALHITIPTNLKFSYGLNSFKKHLTIAKKNKIKTKILNLNSIQLDVDNEKDLTELTQKEPNFLDN